MDPVIPNSIYDKNEDCMKFIYLFLSNGRSLNLSEMSNVD